MSPYIVFHLCNRGSSFALHWPKCQTFYRTVPSIDQLVNRRGIIFYRNIVIEKKILEMRLGKDYENRDINASAI